MSIDILDILTPLRPWVFTPSFTASAAISVDNLILTAAGYNVGFLAAASLGISELTASILGVGVQFAAVSHLTLVELTAAGQAASAFPDGAHILPVAGNIVSALLVVIGDIAVAAEVNIECFRGEAPVILVTLTSGAITTNAEVVFELLDGYEGIRLVRKVGYWNAGVIYGLSRTDTWQVAKVYQYTVSWPLPGQEALIAFGKFTIKAPGVAIT